jgi:hypothetical protein
MSAALKLRGKLVQVMCDLAVQLGLFSIPEKTHSALPR